MRKFSAAMVMVVILAMSMAIVAHGAAAGAETSIDSTTIPLKEVKWAHSPYIDTSAAFIGMHKGWFEEVGVKIVSPTVFTPIENAASFISSGSADIVDAGLVQILPALNNIPDVRVFTIHDIFQGQAIMGQPSYKSVEEFVEEGLSFQDALAAAVGQMKGKTLLLAPDPASSGFARVFLNVGELELSDVSVISADYAQHVPMMIARRADFENGGGPTITQMLKRGFKPIIQTSHIIDEIDPKVDISQLTSVVYNGYVASEKFIEENYPTILRIASVNFRISAFINEHPVEAAQIHGPFLNRYGGSQLDTDDVLILYSQVDPFVDFDGQASWYHDEDSPYFHRHWVQAVINSSEAEGVLPKGRWTPETIEMSHQVYADLERLRNEAVSLIDTHGAAIEAAGGAALEFLQAAQHHLSIYNYYDAQQFAEEAVRRLTQ